MLAVAHVAVCSGRTGLAEWLYPLLKTNMENLFKEIAAGVFVHLR